MEAKEERLVARLRHHNPTLTVTEFHIGRIDRAKKNLLIDYLNSLKLNPNIESSPGLETLVSVDLSSTIEQDEIFKNLLAFIQSIGIDDVSITSEPFDEQQPEIESTDSIPAVDSSSRDYTPLNSDDIEELISRDKSDSEFELILSRPRRSSSRDSRRLHSDQSSRDVIGSILRVSEGGRSQSSDWSLVQRSIRTQDHSFKILKPKPHHRIQAFWSRAKKLFKRKRNPPKQAVGQFRVMVSKDSIQVDTDKSKDKGKLKDSSILRDIKAVNKPNHANLNALQKRLEKVSRDVFSMKNKCPGMKIDGPSLDVYTQTQNKTNDEADMKNTKTQTVENKCSSADTLIEKYSQLHSDTNSLSEMSVISGSTESEHQVMKGGAQVAPQPVRGMVTNFIPIYPKLPADLKPPVTYELKPVGGPFFFRRLTSKKPSSHSTSTSCLTTTASNSPISTRSTVTFSSLSFPSCQEPSVENGSASFENVIYTRSGNQYLSCGFVTDHGRTPFERERIKKIQTINPKLTTAQINTSGTFKLPKETQTRPKRRKRTLPDEKKAPNVGTQTFSCSSSTSCTDLLGMKSCGTKTEIEVEKVDKENTCNLLTKQATENKETNSETLMLKCETCQGMLDKQAAKKRKSPGRQKNDRGAKKGYCWGKYPDGNYGFGQSYAPGKVFPVISLATGFSIGNPFTRPATMEKGGNPPCPKICNMFGGKKKALLEELNKQKMELMQMRMVLVAINEELLAECTDTSSDEFVPSSDDTSDTQSLLKANKKVTFKDPLVNERTVNYAN